MVLLMKARSKVSVGSEVVSATVMMSEAEAQQHIETIKLRFDDITALLLELDNRRGWEALGYKSMHQMIQAELKDHLNKSVSQIYRKLFEAKIRQKLSHACENIEVIPARQLEPLGKLPPEQWQDTWEEVTSTAPNGKVSREYVQTVVSRRMQDFGCDGGLSGASLDQRSPTTSNSCEGTTGSPQHSCWNCQHRMELIENHSFYCNRLGVQNLLDKSADARGVGCVLWSYRGYDSDEANNRTQPAHETFILTLPAHLQPLIRDAARTLGMSLVDWATLVLESEAIAAMQPKDKAQYQAVQCRSP